MKNGFSIVIVCKNEAPVIRHVLESAQWVTDDIVVYDSGSTDDTIAIAQQYKNVKLHHGSWEGFGKTKQKATALAKWDWILSLDADEALDEELQRSLAQLSLDDPSAAYEIPFKNFLGTKYLRWGEWGFDSHIRLFHRGRAGWNDAAVHEELLLPENVSIKKTKGPCTAPHRARPYGVQPQSVGLCTPECGEISCPRQEGYVSETLLCRALYLSEILCFHAGFFRRLGRFFMCPHDGLLHVFKIRTAARAAQF